MALGLGVIAYVEILIYFAYKGEPGWWAYVLGAAAYMLLWMLMQPFLKLLKYIRNKGKV